MSSIFRSVALAALVLCASTTVNAGEDVDRGKTTLGSGLFNYPTLINPNCSHCQDEAKRRGAELRDNDRVLAWIRGKYNGGAVPLRFFLVPYRVISDSYGVFVYDHEAGYMRGYEPSYDFTFEGWRNGVMTIKHKDGTLFSALSGRAFDGPRKGEQLKPIATLATDWGYWLTAWPGTVAYHMYDHYTPVEIPNGEDVNSVKSRPAADPRLPASQEIIGLTIGKQSKAYPIAAIEQSGGLLRDTIGGENVVILWLAETHTAAIYAPEVESTPPQKLTLEIERTNKKAPFADKETSSRWGIEGRAIEGALTGKTLRWLPGVQCKWFAWAAEYPETEVFKPVEKPVIPGEKPHTNNAIRPASLQGIIIDPIQVTTENVAAWKHDGTNAVALILDERYSREDYQSAEKAIGGAADLYCWIEVGRNAAMADAHPVWLASLGIHGDWKKGFPDAKFPGKGEVAKAYPWVPIAYREAFEAHLARIAKLLDRVPAHCRGLLLNDLQAGPASCGCGNLQCRWAIDYSVPPTTPRINGYTVASDFIKRVRDLAKDMAVIPIWTTECENQDLLSKNGAFSTGFCGSVPCSMKTCPIEFNKQWTAMRKGEAGPVGVLALSKELGRDKRDPASAAGWISQVVEYLNTVPGDGTPQPAINDKLWIVIQGYDVSIEEIAKARDEAAAVGVAGILIAKTRIDQTYTPKIVPVP